MAGLRKLCTKHSEGNEIRADFPVCPDWKLILPVRISVENSFFGWNVFIDVPGVPLIIVVFIKENPDFVVGGEEAPESNFF